MKSNTKTTATTTSRRRRRRALVLTTTATAAAAAVPLAAVRNPRAAPLPRRIDGALPRRRLPVGSRWFPNWTGGTNTCVPACDGGAAPSASTSSSCHPLPSYMSEDVVRPSAEECCNKYYFWDLETCREGSNEDDGAIVGDADEGSGEWYADYASFECVRDCPSDGGDNCGGLVSSLPDANIELHASASECCDDKFPYLSLGMCVAKSEGTEYPGSRNYYVDYVRGRCVRDCAAEASSPSSSCGGIVTESSARLYTDAAECCAGQLSYIDPLLCTTRSESGLEGGGYEGTFRLYPHSEDGTCVIDHDPANAIVCSIGYACRLLPPTSWVSKLYPVSPAGVEECCDEGLASTGVDPGYCRAKTMGVASRKWFVDYAAAVCHQDCKVDGDSPNCIINTDPSASLYDTPEECCSSKLSYRSQAKCAADSTGVQYDGSNKYFVNYRESKCTRDCPSTPVSNDDGNVGCGGVVGDSSTSLYDDVPSCCAVGLSYMSTELCVDRSDGTATGTGKYYLSVGDSTCVKDTSLTCPSGETCQRVGGWVATVYDTIDDCCNDGAAILPGSVNIDYCRAVSTGTATDKWFQHADADRCAKHCVDSAASPECGIPSDLSSSHYATARECCAAEFENLDLDSCEELSADGEVLADEAAVGTVEYYVDWIHQICVMNCPEESHTACGGIANGQWVDLYLDVDECCKNLHYLDRDDCVKDSS